VIARRSLAVWACSAVASAVASASIGVASLGAQPAAHPAHATLAQAEFNARTSSLEVALRIDPFDLERVLTAIEGEPVDLDTTENVDELVVAYLNATFVLQSAEDADPFELDWVGKEVFVHTAWLYFELPLERDPAGLLLTNRVLFELPDDQLNTVNFRHGERLKTLRHTRETPRHELPGA